VKPKDLRTLTLPELEQRLREAQEELFNLRFQHKTGQLNNALRIREVRKDVARLMSILGEMKGETAAQSGTTAAAGGGVAGE
jgi:large subunit ribosomal protein L29